MFGDVVIVVGKKFRRIRSLTKARPSEPSSSTTAFSNGTHPAFWSLSYFGDELIGFAIRLSQFLRWHAKLFQGARGGGRQREVGRKSISSRLVMLHYSHSACCEFHKLLLRMPADAARRRAVGHNNYSTTSSSSSGRTSSGHYFSYSCLFHEPRSPETSVGEASRGPEGGAVGVAENGRKKPHERKLTL